MVIIDWISAAEHASFNESLFFALGLPRTTFYIFDGGLIHPDHESILERCVGNRFVRALRVFRICWKNRTNTLLLLTYDPLFAPLLHLVCERVVVYEHNTTPERPDLSKHAVWQRIFCHRLVRCAQFPNQMEVLSKLGQKCVYIGSPLGAGGQMRIEGKKTLFLAPSWRFHADELLKVKDLVGRHEVLIKRGSIPENDLGRLQKELNANALGWIDLDDALPRTIAVIITISSVTRGSGWFNEAIRFGIPLIITNRDVQDIFRKTFPCYPFIDPASLSSADEFEARLQEIRAFPHAEYISKYNNELRDRFMNIMPAPSSK